jgi:hypothetical protein
MVVHLWVEDFLEIFTTVLVAYLFVMLGVVRHKVAMTIIYLDHPHPGNERAALGLDLRQRSIGRHRRLLSDPGRNVRTQPRAWTAHESASNATSRSTFRNLPRLS